MSEPSSDGATRAGFCAIVGRPNVGKSTLLNQILNEKLAAVTPKPQTTRNRILGVKNLPGTQVVFLDTPGIHRGRSPLNRYMVDQALRAMEEVDVILLMVETPRVGAEQLAGGPFSPGPGVDLVLEQLRKAGRPTVLALNKVDLLKEKEALLPLIESWRGLFDFAEIIPMSATEGLNVETATEAVAQLLPEGPFLFPEEMVTDRAERFLASELIREQLFLLLEDELPYAAAVTVESFQERESGDVAIEARVHVERQSQKGIVIGKGGSLIKEIGSRSRVEIGKLLGCPVHLRLQVKVDPGWSRDPSALRRLGYE